MRALSDICEDLQDGVIVAGYGDVLSESWAELLRRYEFNWFVTFTFRDQVHPERADKAFKSWINELNRFLYGRRVASTDGVFWVRALEWQRRGVIHFHALLGDVVPLQNRIGFNTSATDKVSLLYWCELWFRKAGICRIEEIRSHEDVTAYVSKYVAKDGEIDVSENLRNWIPPQSGFLGR